MTGGTFEEVDFDLLADYVGGALDGTPEADAVARLVADDPVWQAAHDELVQANAAVAADLAAWGAEPEPMPDDVVTRLTAALTGVAPATGAAEQRRPHVVPVPAKQPATPGGGRPAGRAASRRRLRRWAAPLAAAAGVLAFAGFGLNALLTGESAEMATSTAAGGRAEQDAADAAGGSAPDTLATDQILATGTDYTAESLTGVGTRAFSAPQASVKVAPHAAEPAAALGDRVADSLERLADRNALLACLDAIAAEHGRGTIVPRTVDYARFNGTPALVVNFAAAGQEWAWVSGPRCGTAGAGADTRYAVQVR